MRSMLKRNLKDTIVSLLQTSHLLSANAILSQLEASDRPFNKTSVYRALDQLLAEQQICKHHFTEDEAQYELRSHHHAHLVCSGCGAVKESACKYTQPNKVGEFLIDHHHLRLIGTCGRCQSRDKFTFTSQKR